jgi:hypothetical protein
LQTAQSSLEDIFVSLVKAPGEAPDPAHTAARAAEFSR